MRNSGLPHQDTWEMGKCGIYSVHSDPSGNFVCGFSEPGFQDCLIVCLVGGGGGCWGMVVTRWFCIPCSWCCLDCSVIVYLLFSLSVQRPGIGAICSACWYSVLG